MLPPVRDLNQRSKGMQFEFLQKKEKRMLDVARSNLSEKDILEKVKRRGSVPTANDADPSSADMKIMVRSPDIALKMVVKVRVKA